MAKVGGPIMKQFVLQSCFYILLRHTNIMTDKGFNPFDECAARCVNLFPQEKVWGQWQHSKFTEDAN